MSDTTSGLPPRSADASPYVIFQLPSGVRIVLVPNRLRVYRFSGLTPIPFDSLDLFGGPRWTLEPSLVTAVQESTLVVAASDPLDRSLLLAQIPPEGRITTRDLPGKGGFHHLACTDAFCAAWYTDTTHQAWLVRWSDIQHPQFRQLSTPLAGLHAGEKGIWGWTHRDVFWISEKGAPRKQTPNLQGYVVRVTDRYIVTASNRHPDPQGWVYLRLTVYTHSGKPVRTLDHAQQILAAGDTLWFLLNSGRVVRMP